MTRWGIKTIDGRGRRVPLLKANRAAFFPTEELRAIAPEARSAVAASQRVPSIVLVIVGWMTGAGTCFGLSVLMPYGQLGSTPLDVAIRIVIFLLLMWSFAWFGGTLNRGLRHRALADAILHTGHCASCGYPMRFLPPHSDGCSVCPECGAAWRADRLLPAADPLAKIGPELWEQE